MAANMLAAYYGKNNDSRGLFSGLKIAEDETFEKHLNKYNVIHINMIDLLSRADSMDDLIDYLQKRLLWDIRKEYSDVDCFDWNNLVDVLETIYNEKRQPFVIIIDEWLLDIPSEIEVKYIVGQMNADTATPMRLQLPGGELEEQDFIEGKMNLEKNLSRELLEEVGIDLKNKEVVEYAKLKYIKKEA